MKKRTVSTPSCTPIKIIEIPAKIMRTVSAQFGVPLKCSQ